MDGLSACNTAEARFAGENVCKMLNDTSDVFGPCFSRVSYKNYLENCIRDYCSAFVSNQPTTAAVCSAHDAMSRECLLNNVVVRWRTQQFCRKYRTIF